MTEQELNVFLDLEWNCAAFTPETEHISAPLSPKQWARIISRHPELQEFCPFAEFTTDDWITILTKQLPFAWRCTCWKDFTPSQWQRLLRHQPTLLHYCEIPDHPAVRSGLLASDRCYERDIDTHDFTLGDWFWTVKHNPSTWFHCPCRNSSRNRCGGASCTALPTCCQTAPTLTSSAMRIGAVLTSFRN